jgi:hypothetical protein
MSEIMIAPPDIHWPEPPNSGWRFEASPQRLKCAKERSIYRASKVIGSSVLNEAGETIGKIDDLLVTRDDKEPYAVVSIGGFLGLGTHMVAVRYDSLRFDPDNKIVLPGGTKEGLTMLPAFEYAKQ